LKTCSSVWEEGGRRQACAAAPIFLLFLALRFQFPRLSFSPEKGSAPFVHSARSSKRPLFPPKADVQRVAGDLGEERSDKTLSDPADYFFPEGGKRCLQSRQEGRKEERGKLEGEGVPLQVAGRLAGAGRCDGQEGSSSSGGGDT